jgi:hypothetical protein
MPRIKLIQQLYTDSHVVKKYTDSLLGSHPLLCSAASRRHRSGWCGAEDGDSYYGHSPRLAPYAPPFPATPALVHEKEGGKESESRETERKIQREEGEPNLNQFSPYLKQHMSSSASPPPSPQPKDPIRFGELEEGAPCEALAQLRPIVPRRLRRGSVREPPP